MTTRVAGRVGFVVPTRNSARTIAACLASLRAQEHPDCEIVVVDNHSDDRTREIAATYADEVVVSGPERSAQRNHGARISSGSILVFVDADMRFEPGVAGDVVRLLGPGGDERVGAVVVPEHAFGEGFWARCRVLEKELYLGDPAVEAARAFRAGDFEAAGGYDESLTGGEDWELPDRVIAGGRILGRTESRVWHDEGRIRLRSQFSKKRYYGRGVAAYLSRSGNGAHRPLVRRSLLRRPLRLARRPHVTAGLAVLKAVELSGIASGVLEARRRRSPVA
ncbi:MAG: glycosyltransferase [Acidimicrobiia bacterium]|nr:glycosyltransferase [Acidimicrobiia bacterium]